MADNRVLLPPLRRVVTGHDERGIAKVLMDGPPPDGVARAGGQTTRVAWATETTPAEVPVGLTIAEPGGIAPSPPSSQGTRLIIIDFPAENIRRMHRTETLDYLFVLAGEIDYELDDSSVQLKAGDVLIQRGTNHAWVNRSGKPARVAFVLIGAKPLGISPETTRPAGVPNV